MKILYITPVNIFEKSLNGTSIIVKNFYDIHSKSNNVSLLIVEDEIKLFENDKYRDIDIKQKKFSMLALGRNDYANSIVEFDFDNYEKIVVFRADMFNFIKLNKINSSGVIFYPIDLISRIYKQRIGSSANFFRSIYDWYQYLVWTNLEKSYLQYFKEVFFVSSMDSKMASRIYGTNNIFSLRNGVENVGNAGIPCSNGVIGFSGDFAYRPNLDAFNLIFEYARFNKDDSFTFKLIGRNPPVSASVYFINNMTIEVTGEVDDVNMELMTCSLFLSPLATGAGMKNKILQVMNLGLPIVATQISVDGIDELVFHQSYIEITTDFSDWASKINAYMSASEKNEHIIINKGLINANYTWDKVLADFNKIVGIDD